MNAKHGIPRVSGLPHASFRRSSYLDGPSRTFFGPGQRPDSPESSRRRPSDWPAAGTLLRVPQVVWLSGLVSPTDFYQFTRVAEQIRIDYGLAGGATTYPNPHFVTNKNLVDFREWQAIFLDAQARIEAIRPNRTWVHVPDWLSWSPGPDSSSPPFLPFAGVGPGSEFQYRYTQGRATYLPFRSPLDSDDGDFFGTNFLHFYVGHWGRDEFGSRSFNTTDVTPVLETSAYIADKSNIEANAPKFHRFSVRCYGYTQTWEQYPLASEGDVWAGPNGGTFNDYIRSLNSTNTNDSLDSNDLIMAACGDLEADGVKGSDIRYAGLFDGMSSGDVVAAIASHFGFDPDTGKDVG